MPLSHFVAFDITIDLCYDILFKILQLLDSILIPFGQLLQSSLQLCPPFFVVISLRFQPYLLLIVCFFFMVQLLLEGIDWPEPFHHCFLFIVVIIVDRLFDELFVAIDVLCQSVDYWLFLRFKFREVGQQIMSCFRLSEGH